MLISFPTNDGPVSLHFIHFYFVENQKISWHINASIIQVYRSNLLSRHKSFTKISNFCWMGRAEEVTQRCLERVLTCCLWGCSSSWAFRPVSTSAVWLIKKGGSGVRRERRLLENGALGAPWWARWPGEDCGVSSIEVSFVVCPLWPSFGGSCFLPLQELTVLQASRLSHGTAQPLASEGSSVVLPEARLLHVTLWKFFLWFKEKEAYQTALETN